MARSYYEILQLNPAATPDEIKEAYRSLAWKVQSNGDQQALKEVNDAYSVLSSPDRRAEYDRMLAAGTAPAAAQAQPAAPPSPSVSVEPEGPGFHPILTLLGNLFGFSGGIFRMRYYTVPFNYVLGFFALIGIVTSAVGYVNAPSRQVPFKSTVATVVHHRDKHDYVTVTGDLDREPQYKGTKDGVVTRYYALYSGMDILIVKGRVLPEGNTFTGKLTDFSDNLGKLVADDAKDPSFPKGATIDTLHYLDMDYIPTAQDEFRFWFFVSVVGALLLLIPPFFRYSIFSARRGRGIDPDYVPQWPIRVMATGKFISPTTGGKLFNFRIPAALVRTDDPSAPLQARFVTADRRGQLEYQITIPADSEVSWGYDYGTGRARPAVRFSKGRWSAKVCVPSEADAKWLADAISSGRPIN